MASRISMRDSFSRGISWQAIGLLVALDAGARTPALWRVKGAELDAG